MAFWWLIPSLHWSHIPFFTNLQQLNYHKISPRYYYLYSDCFILYPTNISNLSDINKIILLAVVTNITAAADDLI